MAATDRHGLTMSGDVSAPFGVVVGGEPRALLADSAAMSGLRRLLDDEHLLVLHGELTDDEHLQLVANFGRVLPQGPRVVVNDRPGATPPTVTFVSNVAAEGGLGRYELAFHGDLFHVATPLDGLSLHAIEVEDGSTATRFASTCRAYGHLPLGVRERLTGLQALFVANYTMTTAEAAPARSIRDELDPTWPRTIHPVVVPHPATGAPCLTVNEMMTTEILGLPDAESDELLDVIFGALYDPSNVHEHRWHRGDLLVWDNLAIQHARSRLDADVPRILRRVVFGARAPWEDWPHRPGSRERG